MRQETFTILFLMRKGRTKKNGLASIYARITTGSLRQEFYFHCEGRPELWNQKKERMMGTSRLALKVNEMLDEFRVQILDIRTKLLAEGYAANAAQIKQRYLNPTCNTMMLIAGLADYAKRRQGEVGVRITQRTADKYERLLRYLKQYLAQRGKAEDIPVERMNYEFLDGFNLFLQTAHRCRHNGAVAVMDCLRNFVLYCLRNEWITKNPFRYYKLKEDEVQAKEHLTAHELELLTRKELDHRLARIRDVFVFCCLTGLAFADADHLRREHLSQDDEGRWWIHKPREKTSVMSRIPLLPASLEILRRYERDEACLARGRVLPTPSNQKMNAYMKEIAAVCGIDKVLTTHCARHTFACMAVEYGMPIDVLAKILGHSNTNMTRHYAKFSETVIGREMEAFGERLASATGYLKGFGQKRPSDEGRRRLSLALFNQRVAQQIQKPCQPQLAVDDPTAALDGIVDTDIEHPREQLDQLFHIGTGTVDTPSHAGSMQRRNQLHEIRRRERLGQIERRAGFFGFPQPVHDRRMLDTQMDHPHLKFQM